MNAHFTVSAGYDQIAVRMNIDRVLREKHRGVPYDSVPGGSIAVCGNGPSLKTCELPKGPCVALNGALEVLVSRGVEPKYAICYDPSKENASFYRKAPKKTTYFIASRCHPDVFAALKGRDVRIFHIFDEPEMEAAQRGHLNARLVPGGSTVGLKSLLLLAGIGYDHFDLYGYDSCLAEDGSHHATRQEWNDGQEVHTVQCNGKEFKATTWMCAQAQEAVDQFDQHKTIYTVDVKGDGMLKALWEETTMETVYDLNYCPPTFNFLEWMMNIDIDRRVNGFKRLKVWLRPGANEGFREEPTALNTASKTVMLDNVVRPILKMFGAVEGGRGRHPRPGMSYVVGPCVAACKKGAEVPVFGPKRAARAWAHKLVGNEPFVTITLRESYYWESRNSNIEAWKAFAKTLKCRVIFVRDTDRADEPLENFETCPIASRDLEKRMALYQRAKMNYFVSNGPAMLAMMGSTIPYICFMPHPSNGYHCNSSEWLKKHSDIQRGDQWPWASDKQRMVWEDDTLENILRADKEHQCLKSQTSVLSSLEKNRLMA